MSNAENRARTAAAIRAYLLEYEPLKSSTDRPVAVVDCIMAQDRTAYVLDSLERWYDGEFTDGDRHAIGTLYENHSDPRPRTSRPHTPNCPEYFNLSDLEGRPLNCATCSNPIEYRLRSGWIHTDWNEEWDGDTTHQVMPDRTVTYACGGITGHSQGCVLSECVHLAVLERRVLDAGHKCWNPDCIHPNCDLLNHVDCYGKFFRKEWAPCELDGLTFIPMTAKFGRVGDAVRFTEKHLVSGHSSEANVVRTGALVVWLAVVPNERAVPGYEGYVWSMVEAAGATGTYGSRVAYVNGIAGPYEF